MKDELQDLLAQKKEIEAKIRELRNNAVICGRAKLDIEHFPTEVRHDEWIICVRSSIGYNLDAREVWRTIIRDSDKQRCINQLDIVIGDLGDLRKRLMEEKADEQTEV